MAENATGDPAAGGYLPHVLEVPLVRLDADLPVPAYARPGDAGVDLLAREPCVLAPGGGRATVPTGIAIELPDGYAALVQPRSGLAARHGVTCLNAPGLIDPGYRGEIGVVLLNTDPVAVYEVHRGDRIAQLVVYPFERVRFVETSDLAASSRGAGGFGHTGR
jgi:dUTP pyrophosphatase